MSRLACFLMFPAMLFAAAGDTAERAMPRVGENFTLPQPAIAMIWIRPGTFMMSSTLGAGDDTVVTLTRGYWLGRTEVTQAQWQAVAERIPVFQNVPLPSFFKGSDRPVEKISWLMAAAFCARLTELERAAGRLPDGYEYALPTEAQWEYACRAGTTGTYPGDLDAMSWYEKNSGDQSHPVAQRQPNAWGLYDMTGNVTEWCADWYDGYPGGHAVDPTGPVSGVYRVQRGGSWNSPAGTCRSALRNSQLDWYTGKATGMRLALVPQRPAPAEAGRAGPTK